MPDHEPYYVLLERALLRRVAVRLDADPGCATRALEAVRSEHARLRPAGRPEGGAGGRVS